MAFQWAKAGMVVSVADIIQARQRISDFVLRTPCAYSQKLSMLTSCEVYLKLENFQMTGAYKQRGSFNKILQLSDTEKKRGVITSSAGNHAQGVAYASQCNGIDATIVMPRYTPLSKIEGTREFQAKVILHGDNYEEAFQKAKELKKEHGLTFVHPFDDPVIIAGQGTIGLELYEQRADLEVLVIPVGGGGLIAGIATVIKEVNPKVRIVGVQAEMMPSMQKSLAAGKVTLIPSMHTIAEGIAVAKVGKHTFPIVKKYVDEVVTVGEEEIAHAVMILLEREKKLVEGAGAAGLAALCHDKIKGVHGKRVGLIISGGNIDITLLSRILERGLLQEGRLANFKVVVPDRPGVLQELSSIVAHHEANILQISHNRAFSSAQLEEAEVEFTLETKGHASIREIMASLQKKGFAIK